MKIAENKKKITAEKLEDNGLTLLCNNPNCQLLDNNICENIPRNLTELGKNEWWQKPSSVIPENINPPQTLKYILVPTDCDCSLDSNIKCLQTFATSNEALSESLQQVPEQLKVLNTPSRNLMNTENLHGRNVPTLMVSYVPFENRQISRPSEDKPQVTVGYSTIGTPLTTKSAIGTIPKEKTSDTTLHKTYVFPHNYRKSEENHDLLQPNSVLFQESDSAQNKSNMKLQFCENVVNLQKYTNVNMPFSSYVRNKSDMCMNKNDSSSKTPMSINKMNECISQMNTPQIQAHENSLSFHEDSSFVDIIVDGCIKGENIATKYQNVPCFKNIKKLCEKTKNDVMTPHSTTRNIHSQGIPWATKDYIFAFTRLTSCWYLLKGYLGQKSDVFEKIEQLYSPDLRKSFEVWERALMNLSFHIMQSFVALGSNGTSKWYPKAHSTPLNCSSNICSVPPVNMFSTPVPLEFISSIYPDQYVYRMKESEVTPRTSHDPRHSKYFMSNKLTVNNNPIGTKESQLIKNSIVDAVDSDDDNVSKEYIKPGCYPVVPKAVTVSFGNDKEKSLNDIGRNEVFILPEKVNTPLLQNTDSNNENESYMPFKDTPEGMMTNAMLKLHENNFPKPPFHLTSVEKLAKRLDTKQDDLVADKTDTETQLMSEIKNLQLQKLDISTHFAAKAHYKSKSEVILDSVQNNIDINDVLEMTIERHVQINKHIKCLEETSCIENKESDGSKTCEKNKENLPCGKFNKIPYSKRPYRTGMDMKIPYQKDKKSLSSCFPKQILRRSINNSSNAKKYEEFEESSIKMQENKKQKQSVEGGVWYSNRKDHLNHHGYEKLKKIINAIWKMQNSHYFVFEVDVKDFPNYYEVVKYPIFLSNILQKVDDLKYANIYQFVHDVRRVFKNFSVFLEEYPDSKIECILNEFVKMFDKQLLETFPHINFSFINGDIEEMHKMPIKEKSIAPENSPSYILTNKKKLGC